MPIWTYRLQWSLYRRTAAVNSCLQLIQATPSSFFIGPPWDNERPAGFDFPSLKQRKVRRSRIRRIEMLADRFNAFAAIKSPRMRRRCIPFLRPFTKTGPGTAILDFSA
jgi:hypothetical protein